MEKYLGLEYWTSPEEVRFKEKFSYSWTMAQGNMLVILTLEVKEI